MNSDVFTPADRAQFLREGRREEELIVQLERFRSGFPYTKLVRPCTVGSGITVIPREEFPALIAEYTHAAHAGRLMKFVPASGAASRMFHTLLTVQACDATSGSGRRTTPEGISDADWQAFEQFCHHLPRFAFYDALDSVLAQQGFCLTELRAGGQFRPLLDALLTPAGLDYATLPKALLLFHRYANYCRTPVEEHLVEAAHLMLDKGHVARLHFTVSPAHYEAMQHHIDSIRSRYEGSGVQYAIRLSIQKPETDTLAVDLANHPIRLEDGSLLFRPAGHGALIENMHDVQGDILWIKNIDNVVPDHLKEDTYVSTKVLGGYLSTLQRTIFTYLEELVERQVKAQRLHEMLTFARDKLCVSYPEDMPHQPLHKQTDFLYTTFNRPLRVCGVVPNTGEPGGGPFWVEDADGTVSLQIVETSQIDPEASEQQAILASSTHFNPVNLVCGVRDFRGHPFDLRHFVDPETGFIATKSHAGQALKALELPGLWNGAMGHWNTVFVEIPLSTFNPVKTVFDLLRDAHQPQH